VDSAKKSSGLPFPPQKKIAPFSLSFVVGINNPELLTAKLYHNDKEHLPIETLEFIKYDNGEYIIWRDLIDLSPGIYKVKIFFSNYVNANLYKKIKGFYCNNHLKNQFIFRLSDGLTKKGDQNK